jgi:Virulence-associated protein E/Bifunctional DNA primase/polymerase, N-terminal/Primase C terminal 2 (PriCT-2)
MLEPALAYSRMRWRIFPCHTVVDGRCSCGKASCSSAGKHPRTKQGFREATDDPRTITGWWTRWPDSNIGIATGGGLVVIDIDGPEGIDEFKALVQANQLPPATLSSQTGRGAHLVFATPGDGPEVRSAARGHVHVRGEGGYIIAPPSRHHSGRTYQWIRKAPVAILPDWLRQWSQGYEISKEKATGHAFAQLGPLPAHLSAHFLNPANVLSESLKTAHSPAEELRLKSALQAIDVKACSYEDFYKIGMALKELDWERSDGTDIGFSIWDAWCAQSEHYNPAGLEFKWKSFGRRTGVTLGTVYHMAREAGWNGGAPPPAGLGRSVGGDHGPGLNGHANGAATLPAAFLNAPQAIFFPDLNDKNQPRATMTNAKVGIGALGVDCRYDLFHNRMLVEGELISKWNSNELSDHVTSMLRDRIRYRFGFDPGKVNTRDAIETLCLERRFDPVLDYLDTLQWDGIPRLDGWLSIWLGATDNALNRAISRLSLIAAVRRARDPGIKFDQIIVLEGKQGAGKSEAIRILAGSENFSDQKILGVDDRKQQELTEGVWLYEIAELTGLKQAALEHVKAFVSRMVDRARPAYGHYTTRQPRRTVFFGSTNHETYLNDDTGNRRFWPVLVGRIDLRGLSEARDQLWAEASAREARGETHFLPESLWELAASEQESRVAIDPWEDPIRRYLEAKALVTNIELNAVLVDNQFLRMEAREVGMYEHSRAARILRKLKFERYRQREGKELHWRYRKAPSPLE